MNKHFLHIALTFLLFSFIACQPENNGPEGKDEPGKETEEKDPHEGDHPGETEPTDQVETVETDGTEDVTWGSARLYGIVNPAKLTADSTIGFVLSEVESCSVDNGETILAKELVGENRFFIRTMDLKPETTYYYKAFLTIGNVLIPGKIRSFTTTPVVYHSVDLGLSVEWADCNAGAPCPEAYGAYCAWGETGPKDNGYKWNNYRWGTSNNITKYCANDLSTVGFVLLPEDDAARACCGDFFRTPTHNEWNELVTGCSWEKGERNGVVGFNIKSNKNGNSIFLPAGGAVLDYDESGLCYVGERVYCWLSTTYVESGKRVYNMGHIGYCSEEEGLTLSGLYRCNGLPIRPVYKKVSGIRLNATRLELMQGSNSVLTATVSPTDACNKACSWSSSNPSVASVDGNGLVTALNEGTSVITATTADRALTAECEVIVKAASEGLQAVDLGLSVQWASCNLGTTRQESAGDFYAWGETVPKQSFTYASYIFLTGGTKYSDFQFSKYVCGGDTHGDPDNKTTLDFEDDAANVTLGGKWRIPTGDDWNELRNNCTCSWIRLNGVDGVQMVSKLNGNSIFLPGAGFLGEKSNSYSSSSYWSSSISPNNCCDASIFCGYETTPTATGTTLRMNGMPIRAVYDPAFSYIPVTGIELNRTSASLTSGTADRLTLTATVLPEKASNQRIEWSSDRTEVATVDQQGFVFPVSAGTACITATSLANRQVKATCVVTVTADMHNGHEVVDLGLRVKWARCNIGAQAPEEAGNYFAWGETAPKSSYELSNYQWCNGFEKSYSKYNLLSEYGSVDNTFILEMGDDAANHNWGGKWRMPGRTEISELRNECNWIEKTVNGVKGYLIVSRKAGYEGNCIFLPLAGYKDGTSTKNRGSDPFYYWSRELRQNLSSAAYTLGWHTDMDVNSNRHFGLSVRPVCDNTATVMGVIPSQDELVLPVNSRFTLLATIIPTTLQYDGGLTWSSEDETVASVDPDGTVHALRTGTTTIRVKTNVLSKQGSCVVTVVSGGEENGHEYVDLGLSVKWAGCNVGASLPYERGDLFAWGHTETSLTYSWSNYKYCNGSYNKLTKYNTKSDYGIVDNLTQLELSDDAAQANWGGGWRIPTEKEMRELTTGCTWEWTTEHGICGYRVTGKKSGYTDRSIFLPAAGEKHEYKLQNVGTRGEYWTANIVTTVPYQCYSLTFYSKYNSVTYSGATTRDYGKSIRAVCK